MRLLFYHFCCEGHCEAAVSQAKQGSNPPDNRLYLVSELRHCCPSLPLFQGGSYQKVDMYDLIGNYNFNQLELLR